MSLNIKKNISVIERAIDFLSKNKGNKDILLKFLSESRLWNKLLVDYQKVEKNEIKEKPQEVFSKIIQVMRKCNIPLVHITKVKNCLDQYRFEGMTKHEG